jgi:methylmalonyl-CoA/ethylmalonyl-CoA epimerase
MKFHHVALPCRSIEDGIEYLRAIYSLAEVGEPVVDEAQRATVCLVETNDGMTFELVSGPVVESFLRRGIAYYHLCFEVADLGQEIARLQSNGAMLISDRKPAPLFEGREVAFLNTKTGLIELLEAR